MLFLGGRLEFDWPWPPELDCDGDSLVEEVGVATSLSEAETGPGPGVTLAKAMWCSTSVAIANCLRATRDQRKSGYVASIMVKPNEGVTYQQSLWCWGGLESGVDSFDGAVQYTVPRCSMSIQSQSQMEKYLAVDVGWRTAVGVQKGCGFKAKNRERSESVGCFLQVTKIVMNVSLQNPIVGGYGQLRERRRLDVKLVKRRRGGAE